VAVPAVDVGIFLDRRFALESLEADDVCLRGTVAVACQPGSRANMIGQDLHWLSQRCKSLRLEVVILRGLNPLHQHGPNYSHHNVHKGNRMRKDR
jgi:hypothetical protein